MGFFDVLGDIAGGVLDVLPVPGGGLLSGPVSKGIGAIGSGGGRRGVLPAQDGMGRPAAPSTGGKFPGVPSLQELQRMEGKPVSGGLPGLADCLEGALIAQPIPTTVLRAPRKGMVVVECRGQRVAMERSLAIKFGLFRPRQKPPITASQMKKLKQAEKVVGKVEDLTKTVNKIQGKRKFVREKKSGG